MFPSRIEQASHWMPAPSMDNRMLGALEAIIEPLASVLSLWILVWWTGNDLGFSWLLVSVLVFALGFPGRRQLQLTPRRVVIGTLVMWMWTAGLLLTLGFASGRMDSFDPVVVGHWLWLAPTTQLAAHWALRCTAPRLARMQGQVQRAVVVGTNEQGWLLAHRLANSPDAGIDLMGIFGDQPVPDGFAAPCATLGKTNPEIGCILHISEFTVKNHIKSIFAKLDVTNRAQAVAKLNRLHSYA